MKNLFSIGILFLFCLFVASCTHERIYTNAELFDRKDFKSKQLQGKTMEFNEPIMRPTCLLLHDSLLITCNQGSEKIFHTFNLQTKKKIGECVTVGQGPLEMLMPFFIAQKDSIKIFDMMNSTIFTYSIPEFINKETPIPSSRIQLSEKPFWSELGVLEHGFVGVSYKPDSPCYLFAENGNKLKNLGTYPETLGTQYTDAEKINAYRAILTTNGKDRIAVCHFFTDLIDIYDKNGNLIAELHGPDHFATAFKESSNAEVIQSIPDPKMYKDAFYSPVGTKKSLFVLYNGKYVNEPGYNLLAQEIFVFDWNGKPQEHYKLSEGISRMVIDEDNRKIYGVSDSPEYHIVEFNY